MNDSTGFQDIHLTSLVEERFAVIQYATSFSYSEEMQCKDKSFINYTIFL